MEIKDYLGKKKPLIDSAMEKVLPRKVSKEWLEFALGPAAYSYDAETISKSMAKPIWEYLDRGGKRWRPALTLLACEAVGGSEKDAIPFTPIVELVHNGTLCCDDVEDDSKLRRGKPCMHLIHGVDIAVNNGCSLYFLPLTTLYRNTEKLDAKKVSDIYNLYGEELLRVSVGQAMDILWHKGEKENISEDEYLQMVVYKTGVLARFAAKLGAIVGDGSKEQIDALGKFGEAMGIGFQIQDDILELTGGEFKKGKGSEGGDIHEGKRTLLVIKTLEKASAADKARLLEILNSHPTDEKIIKEAVLIIEKYGAIDYAVKKAKSVVEDAWKKIDSLLPESEAKATLKSLAEYCTQREI